MFLAQHKRDAVAEDIMAVFTSLRDVAELVNSDGQGYLCRVLHRPSIVISKSRSFIDSTSVAIPNEPNPATYKHSIE